MLVLAGGSEGRGRRSRQSGVTRKERIIKKHEDVGQGLRVPGHLGKGRIEQRAGKRESWEATI